jgi:hypothetical protein
VNDTADTFITLSAGVQSMSVGYRAAQVMAVIAAGAMGVFLLRSGPLARPVEFGMFALLIVPYVYFYYNRRGEPT